MAGATTASSGRETREQLIARVGHDGCPGPIRSPEDDLNTGYCARWDNRRTFEAPTQLFHFEHANTSISGFITDAVVNLHNTLMHSKQSKWIKIAGVVAMDLLLLPAAVIAVIEAIVRLPIGGIIFIFNKGDFYMTGAISFSCFLTAFLVLYETFTAPKTINFFDIYNSAEKITFCNQL